MRSNNIITMNDLNAKVKEIRNNYNSVTDKLKKTERRIEVLNEHLEQCGNYSKYKNIYKKYKSIPPKKQVDFYFNNRPQLALYENAKEYLDKIMNGKTTISTNAWKKELAELTKEKALLYQQFYPLKEEIRAVEIIKRDIETIVGGETPKRKISRDMER